MASGLLGKANPAATTWTLLYTVPSGKLSSFSINACNQSATTATVLIAISASGTALGAGIVASEYVEYNAVLAGQGSILERTGLVTSQASAAYVWVQASTANVSFQAYGYEE
jgi:hypothetical protein